MIFKFARILLYSRWLIIGWVSLAIMGFELYEHRTTNSSTVNFSFWSEIAVYSLAFPFVFGVLLSVLANISIRSINIRNMMPKRIQSKIKRRVLVVENDLLMGASVESLLLQENGLEVIGISPHNEEDLISKIQCLQPEIVVLDETTYLTSANRLLVKLRKHPEFLLIVVNANKNLVYIYHKYTVVFDQVSDLMHVFHEK
ncbi:MAG: hypothetical protein KDI79_19915 [Anaerolineae bacterium]|nr:hypothetical protein [Anaerolineae bacterium]